MPPLEVFLVEDNPADVRLTVEAFRELGSPPTLTVVRDGVEALTTLLDRFGRKETLPDLILLDLNLPRMDGREVLEKIKTHAGLKHIPVVILTTSQARQDVHRSYELGANAFVNKPVDLEEFLAAIKVFAAFWFDTARLSRQ